MLHFRLNLGPTSVAMIILANGLEPSFAGEAPWSYVTYSGETVSPAILKVPEAVSERIVVFLGEDDESTPSRLGLGPVVAIDTDSIERRNQGRPTQAKEIPDPSLAGILWPGKDDQIVAKRSGTADGRSADGSRNPWMRLSEVGSRPTDSRFSCGGVVISGEAGPIAILNGSVVREGATLGGFVVRRIGQEGVVLERSSALYMVPKGKRAIIATPED